MPSYPIKGAWIQVDRTDAHLLYLAHWSVSRGYVQGFVNGRIVLLHRLILGLGKDDPVVDHRNLDGLDNRRKNLRLATRAQNGMNRTKRRDNKSGYKGVHRCRQTGLWRAEISAEKVKHKLGRFADPVEAARAYDEAARRLHGDFARTNF